jgi:hypothetical protein
VMGDTLSAGEKRSLAGLALVGGGLPTQPAARGSAIRAPFPTRTESARPTTIGSARAATRTMHPRRVSRPARRARL